MNTEQERIHLTRRNADEAMRYVTDTIIKRLPLPEDMQDFEDEKLSISDLSTALNEAYLAGMAWAQQAHAHQDRVYRNKLGMAIPIDSTVVFQAVHLGPRHQGPRRLVSVLHATMRNATFSAPGITGDFEHFVERGWHLVTWYPPEGGDGD